VPGKNKWTPPDPVERVREINTDPKDPPPSGMDLPLITRKPQQKPMKIADVLKNMKEKNQT